MLKAAREALADGEPRMVSVQPEDLLAELGVKPGEHRDGVRFASNMCPSKGTMDIFVEPVLPQPSLVILGASPVAMSLAGLARQLGYHVTLAAPAGDLVVAPDADVHGRRLLRSARRIGRGASSWSPTQGRGDEAALRAALATRGRLSSPLSAAAARWRRCGNGSRPPASPPPRSIASRRPAGLDLGAITPEEIAMSILAEITLERRRGHRVAAPGTSHQESDHADE